MGGDGGGGGRCSFGPSRLTVQFLNRWMLVSWWSWEEEGEAFCWAAEAACAVGGIKQHTSSNALDSLPQRSGLLTGRRADGAGLNLHNHPV